MPPVSKRQEILEYLRTVCLPKIKRSAAYNFDVKLVERGLRHIESLDESKFPALFISETDEVRENLTKNQFKATLTAYILGYVKNRTGINQVQLELDQLIDDVARALEEDRLQGNRVKWTEVKRVRTDRGDLDPHAAMVVEVEFTYTDEGFHP